jgi:hypothetical protein
MENLFEAKAWEELIGEFEKNYRILEKYSLFPVSDLNPDLINQLAHYCMAWVANEKGWVEKAISYSTAGRNKLEEVQLQDVGHFGLAYGSPASGMVESLGAQATFLVIGGSRIALMEPAGDGGLTSHFAQNRGEGLLLLTLGVSDLSSAVQRLRSHGVECGEPLPSGELFVHGEATCGVRLRLITRRTSSSIGLRENHG